MKLKTLRLKNFFSVGNSFLELDLQKYKKCVISGSNGNGKSTIANGITFALFNKTLKDVNKALIVNSINGKNCVVEIDIEANNHAYTIRRGIKPNIFEIIEDGLLIDQMGVVDHQEFLEEKILKCSYRTFCQTTILSIENYTPFMSLPKAGRREFIEDVLDIGVFSTMNKLIKTSFSRNREELSLLTVQISALKEKLVLQKSHIVHLEAKQKVGIEALDAKLTEYQEEIDSCLETLEENKGVLTSIESDREVLRAQEVAQKEINTKIIHLRYGLGPLEKDIKFFETNTDCPTCRQGISHDHIHSIVTTQGEALGALKDKIEALVSELSQFASYESLVADLRVREKKSNDAISVATSKVSQFRKMIAQVKKEKDALLIQDDTEALRESLTKDAKAGQKLRERQLSLTEEQSYNTLMLELFKDSGIKSKIVDQYIPVINKLSNEYLEKLDFFVSFELDSEFSETIKSRHRDKFTYDSFSAGERMRIDMALMFTFRRLAKMRNSFSSNLMLLDEILDSSLDSTGIDLLMNILDDSEFSETNIAVISHSNKDLFEDRFDGSYNVYKRDGFTQIT